MTQLIYTNGSEAKNLNPWDLDSNPEAWTFFNRASQTELDDVFYKVAAAYRAINKRAIMTANVPFEILKGKTVIDDSTKWENKVGFLPDPIDLLRRVSLSITFTNKAYLLRGRDILGNTKAFNFLVPTTIFEITNPATGLFDHFERRVNTQIEKYAFDDKNFIHIWQLDHTTELLPSKNTAALAIMQATRQLFWTDFFVTNFFQGGGVKPTVLALKGAVFNERKDEIQRGWEKFLKNIAKFKSKILNADSMDVQQIGSGVDDLKNNEVYKQAIENIALGIGMPVSELMSDFDSFATAQVDRMSWLRDDIFPHAGLIAAQLNQQIFKPLGLYLHFKTLTTDAETQDEVDRATAYSTYVTAGIKPSVAAQMVGIEMPDGVEYTDLDGDKSDDTAAMGAGGDNVQQLALNGAQVSSLIEVLQLVADGQIPRASGIEIIVASFPVAREVAERMMGEIGQGFEPEEVAAQAGPMPPGGQQPQLDPNAPQPPKAPKGKFGKPPVKWVPSIDELKELSVWRDVALRHFKKGEPLDFKYDPHYGGLPDDLKETIKAALLTCKSADEIKAAFDVDYETETRTPAPAYKADPGLLALAAALTEYTKAISQTPAPPAPAPNVNITMSPISLTAQMPEQKDATIVFSPNIQPSEVINQNNIEVQPTPVQVTAENNIEVKPATVKMDIPKPTREKQTIKRDKNTGLIESTDTKIEY